MVMKKYNKDYFFKKRLAIKVPVKASDSIKLHLVGKYVSGKSDCCSTFLQKFISPDYSKSREN